LQPPKLSFRGNEVTAPFWIEVPYQALPQTDAAGFWMDTRAAIALEPGRDPAFLLVSVANNGEGVLIAWRQARPHGGECECWTRDYTDERTFDIPENLHDEEAIRYVGSLTVAWLDTLRESFSEHIAHHSGLLSPSVKMDA
jgi:hypothetical protein